MMELRCESGSLHGRLEGDVIEVACQNRRCGKQPGLVVLHRFDRAGRLIDTRKFRDINTVRGEVQDAHRGIPVRSA